MKKEKGGAYAPPCFRLPIQSSRPEDQPTDFTNTEENKVAYTIAMSM